MQDVTMVVPRPCHWFGDKYSDAPSVILVIDGAKDTNARGAGSALFPECLRPELREVRATIEAYSNVTPLAESETKESVCGVEISKAGAPDLTIIVETEVGERLYTIDRWD